MLLWTPTLVATRTLICCLEAGEGSLAAFRVLLSVVSVLLPLMPAVTQSRGSLLRGCQLDCSSPSRLQAVVNA
jgi:hypothetical protein